MTYAKIIGTGMYVPEKVLTNFDLEKIVDTSDQWITERTGIKERRIASADMMTSDLAKEASIRALESAKVSPEDIDMIIVATITADYLFPTASCILKDKIGNKKAAAYDVSAGCTGLIYALATANAFIKSGIYKNILVVGVESLTKVTNWKDRNTCVLFGDGASAMVLTASDEPGIIDLYLNADRDRDLNLYIPASGTSKEITCEDIKEGKNKIYMNGSAIFKLGVRAMASASKEVLKKHNMTNDDIDWLVPHQANIRIIQSVAKQLKLDMNKVITNIHKYGNTSAASIGIAFDEAVREGKVKKGDTVLFTAFGAGLTWGSLLFRF